MLTIPSIKILAFLGFVFLVNFWSSKFFLSMGELTLFGKEARTPFVGFAHLGLEAVRVQQISSFNFARRVLGFNNERTVVPGFLDYVRLLSLFKESVNVQFAEWCYVIVNFEAPGDEYIVIVFWCCVIACCVM